MVVRTLKKAFAFVEPHLARYTAWSALPAAAGMAVVFWAAAVSGYVLQGPHILELVAGKMAGPQSLTVHQYVTLDDPLVSTEPVGMNEELYYLFPDQFRSEIHRGESLRIFVASRGEALTILDGKITSDKEGRFDRYKDLLLYRSRKLLHLALLRHGVDVGVTSLGRMGDRLVYVIGAQYPDDSVSQVWIDKERLLPLRWLKVIPAEGPPQPPDRLDFRYDRWQEFDGGWYPMRVESYYNDHRLRVAEVRRVEANQAIAGEMFSVSSLMTQYAPPKKEEADTSKEGPLPEEDEVQRTIEEFKKKFEP